MLSPGSPIMRKLSNQEIVMAYQAGVFATEIAVMCGISHQRVYQILKMAARQSSPERRLKRLARKNLQYHVSVGNVKRLPCRDCGEENSHAHHHDYHKRLDVIWLCRTCHRKEHDAEKRKGPSVSRTPCIHRPAGVRMASSANKDSRRLATVWTHRQRRGVYTSLPPLPQVPTQTSVNIPPQSTGFTEPGLGYRRPFPPPSGQNLLGNEREG